MLRESDLAPKVQEYFASQGWAVSKCMKIRGKTVDILAVKGEKIAAIEIKGTQGGMQRGIEQALHQKSAVNFSYLAVPEGQASPALMETCKNLGIGLLLADQKIREAVKPAPGEPMPSVREAVLKPPKQEAKKTLKTQSSLQKLFRSRAQILILKLLLLNSESEFHLNDIARKTGLAPPTAAKESSTLVSLDVIGRRRQGNLALFKINKGSMIYGELKRIFLKYELFDEVIREQLPAGVDYALIYGSFAKGNERAGSDIDLLIVGGVEEDALLRSVSRAEREIGREINYNLWSKEEFEEKARSQIPLLQEVLKTPVIMIAGDEREFKRAIKQGPG